MAIRYTTEAKKYILLKGNIAKRMEAERVSDEQMAAANRYESQNIQRKRKIILRNSHIRNSERYSSD